ncbi:MAG: FAD binding domain-containing protein [Stellaceae bacterium]
MYPFHYERAIDLDDASQHAVDNPGTEFLGGGTDIMQLLKDDVRRPQRLIDLTHMTGFDRIEDRTMGLHIGALVKMSDLAASAAVVESYPAVAEALLASASPQVRNLATIGGNLLQRTRCGYFRDTAMACNKRAPGSGCAALGGENRMHAVLGGSDHCIATYAGDLAVALVALDASVVTYRPSGGRHILLEAFHLLPGDQPERENVLEPGEIIVAIEIPVSALARRSHYRKVRDRASFEFALASAAVALDIDVGTIRDARIAMGGVATKPWRAHAAEAVLRGSPANRQTYERAATAALDGAKPQVQNGFKIALAQQTLIRALTAVGV